jgi:hypothetical protein
MAQSPAMQVPGGVNEGNAPRLGFWTAILLAALAATAFALGIATPPRSGPYCLGNCIVYPYTDAVQFVQRDYLWVAPALLLFPVFLVLAGCIHPCVSVAKRHLIVIGLCFASIAATIISLDYFVQFQVLEPSLVKGETSTLSLFTQYNPHGFFIALEDLGYLMLSAAFLFIGAAFPGINRLGRAIRWVFLVPAVLAFASFFGMSWHFGFNIEYRFEVAVITIIWTALLVLGVMLAVFFRRGGSELTVK